MAVSDPGHGDGRRRPALARPGADCERGRGLLLVDHLAAAWTVRPRPARGSSAIAGLSLRENA
ncbi:hypothetical protein [Streptomyces sp. ICBB 8177]|uniref:hypothetical protein n=1 Tax=Streptomyces sp. ICBB 8177 TaxID=563922 RepID=UPI00316ABDD4